MNNLPKAMPPYNRWQQYNQQQDVGLLTILHFEGVQSEGEPKMAIDSPTNLKPFVYKNTKSDEGGQLSRLEMDLCNSVLKTRHMESGNKQNDLRACKNKYGNVEPKKERNIYSHIQRRRNNERESKSRKTSIKIGYYDVAHMSIVLNSRPIKNKIYPKRSLLTQINNEKIEKSSNEMKVLQQFNSTWRPNQKRQQFYKQENLKEIKQLLIHRQLKSLSIRPISQLSRKGSSFKMINLERIKLRKIKQEFRTVLKKQFRTLSQRNDSFGREEGKFHFQNQQRLIISKKHRYLKPLESNSHICSSKILPNSNILKQNRHKQLFEIYQSNLNIKNMEG